MAVEPLTLRNGTTADANEVMQLFNEIYSNIDETNVASANKTGTGRFVLQTSPTLTTPTITGGTFTGATFASPIFSGTITGTYTLAGTPTFSVSPTFSAGITIPTTQYVRLNVGGTTAIRESIAGEMSFYTGGTVAASLDSTQMLFGTGRSVTLQSGQRLNLNVGGTSFIREVSAGTIDIAIGSSAVFSANSTFAFTRPGINFAVQPGNRLYLDGGGDTYITESSSNVLDTLNGGYLTRLVPRALMMEEPTNGIKLRFGVASGDRWGEFGTGYSSAYPYISFNANQSDAATNSWSQNNAGTPSTKLELQNDALAFYSAPPGTATGTNAAFWGSAKAFFRGTGELTLPDVASPTTINDGSRRGFAKAWAIGIGTGGLSAGTYNIASMTRRGTGLYRYNFVTSFSSTSYVCVPSVLASNEAYVNVTALSTSFVEIQVIAPGNIPVDHNTTIVCFGV